MRYRIFFLVILCFVPIFAQDMTLTNDDVIKMVETGLSETIIISKIKNSKTDFKLDLSDLKTLSDKKISDNIIAAMLEKSNPKNIAPPKEIEYSNKNAEFGQLSEIIGKTKIYLAVTDIKSREIFVKALSKYPNLHLVDNRKDADFGIFFAMTEQDKGSNVFLKTQKNIVITGHCYAYTYLPVKETDTLGRIRIVWQKTKQQDLSGGITFDKHPAKIIDDFLKAFNKL